MRNLASIPMQSLLLLSGLLASPLLINAAAVPANLFQDATTTIAGAEAAVSLPPVGTHDNLAASNTAASPFPAETAASPPPPVVKPVKLASIHNPHLRPPAGGFEYKYFQEPGESLELGHYDIRYFHGEVEYEEHRETLRHLIRSYLTVFQHLGVETWLAHGTLLGWWWNGRIMPWDFDLDAQVSISTLKYLGENYNRTLHTYEYFDDGDQEAVGNNTYGKDGGGEQQKRSSRPTKSRTYLLDINPASATLERQQGLNVIDARWVDTSNGMFVDITGLAERTPDYSPGVWSCKNYHRYRTRDLFPMRRSEFEGVPATVPYSFEAILREEYGEKSMVATHWQGHHWAPNLKEWVKDLETQ